MATSIELVRPSLPPLPGLIKLPPLDQPLFHRVIMPVIYAFKLPLLHAREDVLSALREGLQATLDEIPFLVAHVVIDDVDRGSVQLEIFEHNDTGIKLYIRDIPGLDWKDLETHGFPTAQLKKYQLTPEPLLKSTISIPILTVQANFISGGLLLGLDLSHVVFDGRSMITLMTRWAKHTSLASEGQVMRPEDKIPRASFDRSTLFRGRVSTPLSEFPYYSTHGSPKSILGLLPSQEQALDFTQWSNDLIKNKGHNLTASDFDCCVWRLSDEQLEALERLICGTRPCNFTANALVGAFLWQRITKARQLSVRCETTTSFLFPVDIRDMVTPPLPATYMGNSVTVACATAKVAEMEASGPEFLYTLAERITEARVQVTADRVQAFIGGVDACTDLYKMAAQLHIRNRWSLGTDIMVSNISSTALNMEWGSILGHIRAIRVFLPSIEDGIVLIPARVSEKATDLTIGLATETMKGLARDEIWTKIMTLVCSEQLV
jgi:hypothetical protein